MMIVNDFIHCVKEKRPLADTLNKYFDLTFVRAQRE